MAVAMAMAALLLAEPAWAQAPANASREGREIFELGMCAVIMLMENSLGALAATVAGILALFNAAFGNYRTAQGFLYVAIGAFILRSLVSLNFDVTACDANAGAKNIDVVEKFEKEAPIGGTPINLFPDYFKAPK